MMAKQLNIVFVLLVSLSGCIQSPALREEKVERLPVIPTESTGETYAFIKSQDLKQMNQVITGFTESFPNAKISILDIAGNEDNRKIESFLKAKIPSIIICLGSLAARMTISVEKKTPIVFSMVINHKRHLELQQDNVTGISMEIPPTSLFTQFKMLMPQIQSIGVPFHPSVSSEIVNDALNASNKMGIHLVKIAVTNPNELSNKLSPKMRDYAGLWMLADTKLYNRNTKAIFELISFSKMQKKPLLAFSEAFLKPGAFFSISIDYRSLGSQIALISKQIVQDKIAPAKIPVAQPIGTYTVINKEVAQLLLGDELDESIYDEVDKIYGEEETNPFSDDEV